MARFFLTASIALAVVLGGISLSGILADQGHGFLSGLPMLLGEVGLAATNLVCFGCNAAYWWLARKPRWMSAILLVQLLPALGAAAAGGLFASDLYLDHLASVRGSQVIAAIHGDDLTAFRRSVARCGTRCSRGLEPPDQLLYAADSGAIAIARYLVAQGARVEEPLILHQTDITTCEGLYLPGRDALSVAIARNDHPMFALLYGASNEGAVGEALETAVQLDRLAIVKELKAHGARRPDYVRGSLRVPLLQIAASGAAIGVGRWLIEERGVPLDPASDGTVPAGTDDLEALARAVGGHEVARPRAKAFLSLLMTHGASLAGLDARARQSLSELLHGTAAGAEWSREPVQGCVPSGGDA